MQLPLPAEVLVLLSVGAVVALAACVALVISRRRRGRHPATPTDADRTGKRRAELPVSASGPSTHPSRTVAAAIAAREAATYPFPSIDRSGVGGRPLDSALDGLDAASGGTAPAPGALGTARPAPGSASSTAVGGRVQAEPTSPTEAPGRFADVDDLEPDVAAVDLPAARNAVGLDWLASAGFTRPNPRITDPDQLATAARDPADLRAPQDGGRPVPGSDSTGTTALRSERIADRPASAAADSAGSAVASTMAVSPPNPSMFGSEAETGAWAVRGSAHPPGSAEAGTGPGSPRSSRPGNETGVARRPASDPATTSLPAPSSSAARAERVVAPGAAGSPVTWRGVERGGSSSIGPGPRGARDFARETAGRSTSATPAGIRAWRDDDRPAEGYSAAPHSPEYAAQPAPDPTVEPTAAESSGPRKRTRGWIGADLWFVPPVGGSRGSSRASRRRAADPEARHAEPSARAGSDDPSAASESSPPGSVEDTIGLAPLVHPAVTPPADPSPSGSVASAPSSVDRPRAHPALQAEGAAAGSSRALAAAVTKALAARAAAPDADRRDDARDRLLAVLLDDPRHAVGAAVDLQLCQERIGRIADVRHDERGRLGEVLGRLARAGLRTDQLARLSGLPADAVTELLRPNVSG